MKHIQTYNIFEKSSLTQLGIDNDVMKYIQYNYELSADAQWNKIGLKKDLITELKKNEIALFLELSGKDVKVIVNLGNDEYTEQRFYYQVKGWGSYDIRERKDITRTQMLFGVDPKSLIYKLVGSFEPTPKVKNKIKKELKSFDDITNEFKFYMLYNFNKIVQKLYGKRYDIVMKTIANNIANFNPNASPEEVLNFLNDNKKMAQKAREYEDAKKDEDILRLQSLQQKYNSLTAIDEYLIMFEEGYSEKFFHRVTIKELIDTFGRMKVETAFMYFLYTGKLKDLNVQVKK